MTELVVFENHDVCLQHVTRVRVPREVNTLELFLGVVSAHIAAFSGDATAAGRYRFVYSLKGKPLWHVSDCLEAGEVVVSCTPGFLERKRSTAEVSASTPRFDAFSSATAASLFSTSCAAAATPEIAFYSHNVSGSGKNLSERAAKNAGGGRSGKGIELDATVFNINGHRLVLPPPPRFVDPALGAVTEVQHSKKVAAVRTLLSLKLLGRPFLVNELLFCEELRLRLEPIVAKAISRNEEAAARVVVEGPPKSGVSTTLAYCCHMVASAPVSRFHGCLFLPLNFGLLFDTAWLQLSNGGKPDEKRVPPVDVDNQQALLLDVPFFFLTLVRLVVDSAVAQRPSLRDDSKVLVEAWEELVTRRDLDAPQFGGSRLAQVVGHRALYEWDAFAVAAVQVLRAVEDSPRDMELRDALIETVLVGFVSHLASALRFSGVVYIIDGLRCLASVLRHRVRRPLGDAGVFLRCLTKYQWAHVIAGVDKLAFPPPAVLLPGPVQCLGLLHLLSPELLTRHYGYPAAIYCGDKRFPLQVLMGAPGYLRALHALLDAHAWTTMEKGEGMSYVLRVEDDGVLHALQNLTKTLKIESDFGLDCSC
ncbi:hypothetical protein TcBrA4_0008760, partial [Trypanosoma cruzi]